MEIRTDRHLDLAIIATFLISLILLPAIASSEDTYRFKRMWPTLQQPWYFYNPYGIAIDGGGNVYVADTDNRRMQKFTLDGQFITKWGNWGTEAGQFYEPRGATVDDNGNVYVVDGHKRIQKFTSDGQFVTKWGSWGSGDGQFDEPHGIAVDGSGNVYVADSGNHRIQKFTPDGQFIAKWGSEGSGDGEFSWPKGIAVDGSGQFYVTDYGNHRIQKFSSNGIFIKSWGSSGASDGQFQLPEGIALDSSGDVYVTDRGNYRIQKFTSDGEFITKWGSRGSGDGQFAKTFNKSYGIAVGRSGNIYVTDTQNDRVQKFSSDGQFVSKWVGGGSGAGQFDEPHGVAVDSGGNVYVVDKWNSRIQKFTAEGDFTTKWGSEGSGDGQFARPNGIAIDGEGRVYVADWSNHRIQKLTTSGQFVARWGSWGSGDGQFRYPEAVAADSSGNVYVVDKWNYRIQKFTAEGDFITKWGSEGSGDGQFIDPYGVAVDSIGNVYVADTENHRIQKFTSNGDFIAKWGTQGFGDGEFNFPEGIAIDDTGKVYVADKLNHRIQKFTAEGEFITKWGNLGSSPGLMDWPLGIAVTENGNIYVSDRQNYRIQVFTRVDIDSNNKAIIVAGGGPYAGNNLWNATQLSANFAYRALTYQGFTKEAIYYLTSDTDLDLDSNGVLDDVDGDVTNNNLEQAITTWAADAASLVVYLVDHGGNGTFRTSGTQTLSASELDSWLDTLQQTLPGKVTVIYDACESGSFLSALTPPSGKERIVITSTSPDESAYFVAQGSVSFSSYVWTHIFNGVNIKDAFAVAKDAIGHTTDFQHPLLDANGNGIGNEADDFTLCQYTYIGNGTQLHGDAPVIGSVSADQSISGTSSAALSADSVTDADGIARVWAVIRPPDYNQGSADNPVQGLPTVDLMPEDSDRYEATYEDFNISGTYQIAIYARDRIGNTSIPKLTTVTVENPLRRRAIIVVGGSQTDPLWPAFEKNATLVYEALIFQGYTDTDIYFMSSVTFSSGVDGLATVSNLSYAFNAWSQINTQDVVLYLVGNGLEGTFQLSQAEALSATALNNWLDNLQDNIPGMVTVIYDGCRAGSFLPRLSPPSGKERILLASTGTNEPACFLSKGDISFSKFFWNRVLNGATVRDSFLHAKNAIAYSCLGQTATIDDNGNGVGNEKSDGQLARNYAIGAGVILAGDDPVIGSVSPGQILHGEKSATIWAENVTTTGTIDKVWAVITPPGRNSGSPSDPVTDTPVLTLRPIGNGRYEGTYNEFSTFGGYTTAVYAKDIDGNISLPKETIVSQTVGPDVYEKDDNHSLANAIVLNDVAVQRHTFDDVGDQDWVMFYALSGETYTITASNLGSSCDVVLSLYDMDGAAQLASRDNGISGEGETLDWFCPAEGVYYLKVEHYDPTVFGGNTEYVLQVYVPIGPLAGFIAGNITNIYSSEPLGGVKIKTDRNISALSFPDGTYLMVHPAGTFTIKAEALGFTPVSFSGVLVSAGQTMIKDFQFSYLDDPDGDGVATNQDNCPNTSNPTQRDSDKDGRGDTCDAFPNDPEGWLDTDADGMPDSWEEKYGLDPKDDKDALEDFDFDGYSNLREYPGGWDPTDHNSHPLRAMTWIPLLLLED